MHGKYEKDQTKKIRLSQAPSLHVSKTWPVITESKVANSFINFPNNSPGNMKLSRT